MPTLHSVTEKTKRVLKVLAIIAIAIISIYLAFRIFLFIRELFFPTPPEPPTVSFGKLAPPEFPESETDGMTYEIDTVTGSLPLITDAEGKPLDRVTVRKIYNPQFSLLDLQNAKAIVAKVGFLGRENITGEENVYLWSGIFGDLSAEMFMNIVSKNFDLGSNFRNSARVLSRQNMPDTLSAIARAESYLDSMNLFPTDIDEGKTRTELLRIQGTELIPVDILREAQVIRVGFFQNDVDNLPIFYENPPFSALNFYVTGGDRVEPSVVEGSFHHQIITDESATYPIKPVETAYEELQAGKAYIGNNFIQGNSVKIKEVVLGYFASSGYQEYLMPIYVFKGPGDEFYAYVLAIPDEWLTTNDNPQLD